MLYTYKTKLYTYTIYIYIYICVNCHNMRNLYHIRVIDKNKQTYNIEICV